MASLEPRADAKLQDSSTLGRAGNRRGRVTHTDVHTHAHCTHACRMHNPFLPSTYYAGVRIPECPIPASRKSFPPGTCGKESEPRGRGLLPSSRLPIGPSPRPTWPAAPACAASLTPGRSVGTRRQSTHAPASEEETGSAHHTGCGLKPCGWCPGEVLGAKPMSPCCSPV